MLRAESSPGTVSTSSMPSGGSLRNGRGSGGQALGAPLLLTLPARCGERAFDRYGGRLRLRGRVMLRLAVAGADRITVPSGFMQAQAREAESRPYASPWESPGPVAAASPPSARHGSAAAAASRRQSHLVKEQRRCCGRRGVAEGAWPRLGLDVIGLDTLAGPSNGGRRARGLAGQVRFHGFVPHAALRPWMEHRGHAHDQIAP